VEDLGRVALWVEGEREERRLVAESLFGSVLLRPAESEDQRWTDAVGAVGVKRSPQERAFALELFGRYLFPVIGSGSELGHLVAVDRVDGVARVCSGAEDRPFGTGLPRTPAQPAVAVVLAATPVAANERRKWRRSMSLPDVRGCP